MLSFRQTVTEGAKAETAYTSAINQGYSKEQAGTYGALVGISEGSLQYLLGGLSALGGKWSSKEMKGLLRKIDNAYLKVGAKFGGNLLFEGGEEWLQTSLDRYLRNLSLMEENKINLLSEEAIYNGILGALTAGLFETPGMINRIISGGFNQNAAAENGNNPQKSIYEKYPKLWEIKKQEYGWVNERLFDNRIAIAEINRKEVLQFAKSDNKINIQAGFSCFSKYDVLKWYTRNVIPKVYETIDGKKEKYFDVAMHGSHSNVSVSKEKGSPKLSPLSLAMIIIHDERYKKGQRVRLLSCSTGEQLNYKDCFAQKLSNILLAEVEAPTDLLYVDYDGTFWIGKFGEGRMKTYKPNKED